MEHLTLDFIIAAQEDLKKSIIKQRNYEGKSAALRLLGFSCGTAAVAVGLQYLTGETFYTTMVPGLFGITFLCSPNLKGITDYLADLSLGVKPLVEGIVKIDGDCAVRINKLAPKVEYNQSRLKSEPEKYLDEQIIFMQKAKDFMEQCRDETTQISTKFLSTEADIRNSERFEPELAKLNESIYKVYYCLLCLIRGKTLRSSFYQIILEDKTILSKLHLVAAALNYGTDFYSKAQTQPELKQVIEKIGNCILLSTELHWLTTDTATRHQQKIVLNERYYSQVFP